MFFLGLSDLVGAEPSQHYGSEEDDCEVGNHDSHCRIDTKVFDGHHPIADQRGKPNRRGQRRHKGGQTHVADGIPHGCIALISFVQLIVVLGQDVDNVRGTNNQYQHRIQGRKRIELTHETSQKANEKQKS